MEITLNNYSTVLSKELLKKATKCVVRECDESSKGVFIAYVDENKDSYDVSLTINSKKVVTSHECDCKYKHTFCIHKTALLLQLLKPDNSQKDAGTKTKKKIKAYEMLLQNADAEKLRTWIGSLIDQSKQVELSFMASFAPRPDNYTVDQVNHLTESAINATIKNKKNADTTQLKNLVKILKDIHQPILQYYTENATDQNAFNCLHAMVSTTAALAYKVSINMDIVYDYVLAQLTKTHGSLTAIENEESWIQAITQFSGFVPDRQQPYGHMYLIHLLQFSELCNDKRRELLLRLLADQYVIHFNSGHKDDFGYMKLIFRHVLKNQLMTEYYNYFVAVPYDNSYSQLLISYLYDNGYYAKVAKLCWDMCRSYAAGDKPYYLNILKDIYRKQNNEQGLIEVICLLVPYTFNFDDFKYAFTRLTSYQANKFKTQLMIDAGRRVTDPNVMIFIFAVLAMQNEYIKMIDYVSQRCSYNLILKYVEPMANKDKIRLTSNLLKRDDTESYYYRITEAERESLTKIIDYLYPKFLPDAWILILKEHNHLQKSLIGPLLGKRLSTL